MMRIGSIFRLLGCFGYVFETLSVNLKEKRILSSFY
jgi:hypothetical protein